MDRAAVRVVSPLGDPSKARHPLARRPASLDGAVIGLFTNGKQNADTLLELVAEELRKRYALKEPIRRDKAKAGSGPAARAPESLLDELSAGAVAVLAASGD